MKIKMFQFNMLPVNCYILVDDNKNAVIIDPGAYYPEEKAALKDYIINEQLNVEHVLVTHLHPDHMFGLSFLYQEFGLKAEANEADEALFNGMAKHGSLFGMTIDDGPVLLKNYLNNGDVVTFGKTELECIAVPGHSPGSLAFYQKEAGVLFSGDALFRASIGRTDFKGGNYASLHDSIIGRLFVLPDDTVVYPGHGEATTIGFEKENNLFLRD
jgi:hydroxyacylglutathione hydrolase